MLCIHCTQGCLVTEVSVAQFVPAVATGQLRELGTATYRRLQSIIEVQSRTSGRDLRALHNFTQWVQQRQREGHFVGQVVGPLGAEIKLKSRINGRQMDGKWVANLEQVRQG